MPEEMRRKDLSIDAKDRIALCELLPDEASVLQANFARDPRIAVHERDGYAAIKALLTGARRGAPGASQRRGPLCARSTLPPRRRRSSRCSWWSRSGPST